MKKKKDDAVKEILTMDINSLQISNITGIGKNSENSFEIDYNNLGISDEKTIRELNIHANELKNNFEKSTAHLLAFSKHLKDAQDLLSAYSGGVFVKWFTKIGLNKNFVYRMLDRYNLYLETKNNRAMEVPLKVITYFKYNDESPNVINKILSSEKPTKELRQYRETFTITESAKQLSKIELLHNEFNSNEEKLTKLKKQIKMLELKQTMILEEIDLIEKNEVIEIK